LYLFLSIEHHTGAILPGTESNPPAGDMGVKTIMFYMVKSGMEGSYNITRHREMLTIGAARHAVETFKLNSVKSVAGKTVETTIESNDTLISYTT
jgi:hypothetical protein